MRLIYEPRSSQTQLDQNQKPAEPSPAAAGSPWRRPSRTQKALRWRPSGSFPGNRSSLMPAHSAFSSRALWRRNAARTHLTHVCTASDCSFCRRRHTNMKLIRVAKNTERREQERSQAARRRLQEIRREGSNCNHFSREEERRRER